MLILGIVTLLLLIVLVVGGGLAAWYYRTPAVVDRHAAARSEALLAEARLDLLTRQTMQQMRDVVRDDLRSRRPSSTVIEGDIVE